MPWADRQVFRSFAGSGPAFAVSGGVADFVDVGGQDLSGQNLSKKDFSSANARGTKFQKAKLKGARFFKSDLKDADFTGADLSNASLENAKLDNVVLTNAILKGAYTDQSLGNVKDISGADFSDAQIRPDIAQKLCTRPDATGTRFTPCTRASQWLMILLVWLTLVSPSEPERWLSALSERRHQPQDSGRHSREPRVPLNFNRSGITSVSNLSNTRKLGSTASHGD